MTEIMIIGEAWGEEEAKAQAPFVGNAGHMLTQMLSEAGIHRADCYITNVFNIHPPRNKVDWFCGPKSEGIPGYPKLTKSGYVRKEFVSELHRMAQEILQVRPNIIIALGNTPSWALLGRTTITKFRGTTDISTHTVTGFKVLSTFHPSYLFHAYEDRPVTVLDLTKAARQSKFPELRRLAREIWIEPTLEDLDVYRDKYLRDCRLLSVDIETAGMEVTCIGFAPDERSALVVPFHDARRKNRSYWSSLSDERAAWKFVASILTNPKPPKLFQNGLYDISFLWRSYGIKVLGAEHDTMLLHHALQPESLKGLGFLGSVYTDEGAWKQMRTKVTTIKRDE